MANKPAKTGLQGCEQARGKKSSRKLQTKAAAALMLKLNRSMKDTYVVKFDVFFFLPRRITVLGALRRSISCMAIIALGHRNHLDGFSRPERREKEIRDHLSSYFFFSSSQLLVAVAIEVRFRDGRLCNIKRWQWRVYHTIISDFCTHQ